MRGVQDRVHRLDRHCDTRPLRGAIHLLAHSLVLPTILGVVALNLFVIPAWGSMPATTLVSASSIGEQGNGYSGMTIVAVSDDGRFIAFSSKASNLVPGDTNGILDVFVRDTVAGRTTRISVCSSDKQANGSSYNPAISATGRFVAFTSRASNLVPADTNGVPDVFVHDAATGKTTRVDVSSSGEQANDRSLGGFLPPAISARGRFVAFSSKASNLVPDDSNGKADVFVRDLSKHVTTRVSVSSSGRQGNGLSLISHPAAISANGRLVAFTSKASNLVPDDTNGKADVFVRDIPRRKTSRVSVSFTGAQGNDRSFFASISANGRFVVFSSNASNLVPGDTNTFTDVFLRDRSKGRTERVSLSSSGKQGDFISCCTKGVSADGRFVVFTSFASNLVPGDRNGLGDVFLRDRRGDTTTAISVSMSGRTGNSDSGNTSISSDGRFVAFASAASDLVRNDDNGTGDVFIRGSLRR